MSVCLSGCQFVEVCRAVCEDCGSERVLLSVCLATPACVSVSVREQGAAG